MADVVVKKKHDGLFSEFSFSQDPSVSEKKVEPAEKPKVLEPVSEEPVKEEQIIGVNPLTQKPIIKHIEKKPFIRGVIEPQPRFEPPKEEPQEAEAFVRDVSIDELRKRHLQDITPVSNEPLPKPAERPFEPVAKPPVRELSHDEAMDKARKIWEDKEKQKPWHKKFLDNLFH